MTTGSGGSSWCTRHLRIRAAGLAKVCNNKRPNGGTFPEATSEGHTVIPSQWVDTDKHEHREGTPGYTPKYKSSLVSCGNFEDASGLRSDSPTSDAETHNIVKGVKLVADEFTKLLQHQAWDRYVEDLGLETQRRPTSVAVSTMSTAVVFS